MKAVKLKLELFLQASRRDPPGLYSSLAALIWISVSAAIWSFWVTSSAVCLVLPRTTIRLSSSTSEPCQKTQLLEVQLLFSGIPSLLFTVDEINKNVLFNPVLNPSDGCHANYYLSFHCSKNKWLDTLRSLPSPVCWSDGTEDCPPVLSSSFC